MQKVIPVEDAVLRDTFWNAAIDLKKENDQLKSRIKRLEEAGDVLAQRSAQLGLLPMAIEGWREAKEAKL
jgi:hypothetical protein